MADWHNQSAPSTGSGKNIIIYNHARQEAGREQLVATHVINDKRKFDLEKVH